MENDSRQPWKQGDMITGSATAHEDSKNVHAGRGPVCETAPKRGPPPPLVSNRPGKEPTSCCAHFTDNGVKKN